MLSDSYIVPECIVQPGSFGGLMALYEANFIKFFRLVGESNLTHQTYRSYTDRDCDLHLCIDSRSKYTRVFRLTYLFEDPQGPVAEPDLSLKIYLDARMTEVLSWSGQHRHDFLNSLVDRFGRELDRRWTRNMMLGKWLDYLLDRGHSFRPADVAAMLPAEL